MALENLKKNLPLLLQGFYTTGGGGSHSGGKKIRALLAHFRSFLRINGKFTQLHPGFSDPPLLTIVILIPYNNYLIFCRLLTSVRFKAKLKKFLNKKKIFTQFKSKGRGALGL